MTISLHYFGRLGIRSHNAREAREAFKGGVVKKLSRSLAQVPAFSLAPALTGVIPAAAAEKIVTNGGIVRIQEHPGAASQWVAADKGLRKARGLIRQTVQIPSGPFKAL